jgi:hypothetical protein
MYVSMYLFIYVCNYELVVRDLESLLGFIYNTYVPWMDLSIIFLQFGFSL